MQSDNQDKKSITQDDIINILNVCYKKCLNGIPVVSPPVEDLAKDYLKKYKTRKKACKAMMNNQILKCTVSGFVTGFGGLITLPISLPANITSVLYVQMRMIACIACIGGMDLKSDITQTFVYACLAGVAVNNIIKQFGVKFGLKFANSIVKKIPGKTLTKINQKVGFRFVTKFGNKGLLNLGKCVPVVGALVSGGLDLFETKIIADRAYRWFIDGDFSETENTYSKPDDDIIEISEEDFFEISHDDETTQPF